MSLCRIYARNGKVLIPVVAQTAEGMFVDAAPVEVLSLHDRPALEQALAEALHAENPPVPSPQQDEGPGSVILEAVGIRRWEAFERAAVLYTIHTTEEGVMVYATGHGADGMWTRSKDKDRLFSGQQVDDEVVQFLIADMLARKELLQPERTLPMLLPPADKTN